uniref:Ig-like domain-containing protein n=1 Tax=Oreochromis niloticus TaxID=8128 RepID=A0A669E8K7_ORENI
MIQHRKGGGLYEMNSVSSCSDTDGEDVLILDDEVVWYADFNKRKGVDSLPAFADHPSFEGKYEEAVANQQVCRQNLKVARTAMKDFPKEHVKPFVRLHWTKPPVDHHPAILACSIYDFYPKYIKVTWLRNGQRVTSNTTTTEELPDADWFYQIHSYLEYTPR